MRTGFGSAAALLRLDGWSRFRLCGRHYDRELFDEFKAGAADELGDGGGVETCGIVFDGKGRGGAVELEAANAVDLTGSGEGEESALTGLAAVAEDDVDVGHRRMIAERRRLERLEVAEDLGIVPILRADEVAADIALAVDDEGLRPAGDGVLFGDGLLGIADGDEIEVMLQEEALVGRIALVDADGEDWEFRVRVVELEERWGLFHAGRAPTSPEVEEDDFASVLRQVDRGGAVRD